MLDLRAHFSRFLGADPARLHFAAHSHHPWPDATRAAQLRCWDDAARWQDRKWDHVLGALWDRVRTAIAAELGLPDPSTLVPAPNTQEFVVRILSALPMDRRPRILTTDAEFHSFARQVARLEEEGLVEVRRVPAEPGPGLGARLVAAAAEGDWDLIWVSQVFFTSGHAQPVADLAALAAVAGEALFVVDGYHGYLAVPTDLSAIAGRAFYLAGGYKYAMAGEGCCFLHCPPGWAPRPRSTGWYAAFGTLAGAPGKVGYTEDGWRFMGSTFDPSGLYRLDAALAWRAEVGLTTAAVHAHAVALGERLVAGLGGTGLDPARLVVPLTEGRRGNFLTFDLPDGPDGAEAWQARLADLGVVTDRRGTRLRFGFGPYQTAAEVDAVLGRLRGATRVAA